MFQSIVDAVSGSNWSYLIVFAVAMLDAFFPIVPSEATAIAAGVVAGTGGLRVELVILAAALGAIAGDNICFRAATSSASALNQRFFQGEKAQETSRSGRGRRSRNAAATSSSSRASSRAARTAATFTAGFVDGMPWRRFLRYDAIAGAIWGTYTVLLGYFGGKTFEEQPWKGLLLAFVVALGGDRALVELVRPCGAAAPTREAPRHRRDRLPRLGARPAACPMRRPSGSRSATPTRSRAFFGRVRPET